jgi:hypothetical protein
VDFSPPSEPIHEYDTKFVSKPTATKHRVNSYTIASFDTRSTGQGSQLGRTNTGRIRIPMSMFRNPLATSQFAQKIILHENKVKLQKKLTLQMELEEKFEQEQFALSHNSQRIGDE